MCVFNEKPSVFTAVTRCARTSVWRGPDRTLHAPFTTRKQGPNTQKHDEMLELMGNNYPTVKLAFISQRGAVRVSTRDVICHTIHSCFKSVHHAHLVLPVRSPFPTFTHAPLTVALLWDIRPAGARVRTDSSLVL